MLAGPSVKRHHLHAAIEAEHGAARGKQLLQVAVQREHLVEVEPHAEAGFELGDGVGVDAQLERRREADDRNLLGRAELVFPGVRRIGHRHVHAVVEVVAGQLRENAQDVLHLLQRVVELHPGLVERRQHLAPGVEIAVDPHRLVERAETDAQPNVRKRGLPSLGWSRLRIEATATDHWHSRRRPRTRRRP